MFLGCDFYGIATFLGLQCFVQSGDLQFVLLKQAGFANDTFQACVLNEKVKIDDWRDYNKVKIC